MKIKGISILAQQAAKIASKGKFWAIKAMPDGLVIAGTIGFVGTCILVAKGAKKHEEIKDESDSKLEKTKKAVVCYAPAGIVGSLAVGCFTGGHYVLKKRNVALVAAYKAVDEGFKNYRKNVIEKYGEDEDIRLKNGLRVEKESVTEIGEDGKKRKIKKEVEYADGELSGYSFIYDKQHTVSHRNIDPAITRGELIGAENSANVLLNARGYITLNEILRAIDLHETSFGQIVGWQKCGDGDGFVDFNIRQIRTTQDDGGCAFLLEFNVDGPIYQDIDKYTRAWEE